MILINGSNIYYINITQQSKSGNNMEKIHGGRAETTMIMTESAIAGKPQKYKFFIVQHNNHPTVATSNKHIGHLL